MPRSVLVLLCVAISLLILPGAALAAGPTHHYKAGAPGAGDPYFPLDGNGGYDVRHYDLATQLRPDDGRLKGVATIEATGDPGPVALRPRLRRSHGPVAHGRRPRRQVPARRPGAHRHAAPRVPEARRRSRSRSATTASPKLIDDPALGANGFFQTDDGAVVVGRAARGRDLVPGQRPSDRQGVVHVPHHRPERPAGRRQRRPPRQDARSTAGRPGTGTRREPMASYLATADDRPVRHPRLPPGRHPLLGRDRPRPARTGRHAADGRRSSPSRQQADLSYKRLAHTIAVPAGGAKCRSGSTATPSCVGLHLRRGPHAGPGRLDDARGRQRPHEPGHGCSCPFWLELHPFLTHYQTTTATATCSPAGTTGEWWAATGARGRLGAVGGRPVGLGRQDVEVSITYASDDIVQRNGRVRRRRRSSRPATARHRSRTTATRWTAGRVPGPPLAARRTPNDWIVGTVADTPPIAGQSPQGSFARQPEILDFLGEQLRALSVLRLGRHRRRYPGGRVRAREPDPAGLRPRLLHRQPVGRQRRRPRARPPVVRRQRRGQALAGHLAQRGLRHLRRVAVERARGPRHRPGDLRLLVRRVRRRRPVLDRRHRRSGPGRRCSTSPSTSAAG